MDTLADAVVSPTSADNETMPYGSSHWDGKPAEVHAMILKAAGPLTLFLNGLLGDKDSLDRAAVVALWTEAVNIDWQGDLRQLPDIAFLLDDYDPLQPRPTLNMLSLPVSRSMYGRLCTRFPDQATISLNVDADDNAYLAGRRPLFKRIPFKTTRLYHIPMRNGWFDLIDFSHPISLGWLAIFIGQAGFFKHLAEHHGVDLKEFQSLNGRLAMDVAAENGHVGILQVLHEAGNTSCSQSAMNWAAENGHLHVVKWLHENRTEGCTTDAMDLAAKRGHLHVVKWLHANRTEGCSTLAMDWAAGEGHLDVVQWLHANRTEGCSWKAMDWAAMWGNLDVVQWLHENRTEGCSTDAIDEAAKNGNLEVVQFLLECGYEFSFDALYSAYSDVIIDVLLDSMSAWDTMRRLQEAIGVGGCDEWIERLERLLEEKQA